MPRARLPVSKLGLAAIIGAFLAGMVASETSAREELEQQTRPLLALMTPFFFVLTGAKIELAQLADARRIAHARADHG